ncbi:MAG: ABC transporter substrate-binding protein, partial [Clostridia bacterium]|nr:ABC transporter substrate-binding protein [Clostridia bacterium]
NHYQIVDAELDELIIAGRSSADNDFRKATYKNAMEIILDWGVELPLYQRKDCTITSSIRINNDTMPKDMTPYLVWYGESENLAVNAVQ